MSAAPRGHTGFGRLPLAFEENQGQAAGDVKYLIRRAPYAVYLCSRAITLAVPHRPAVRIEFAGASADAPAEGLDRQPGTSNYFFGNDPKAWKTGVPQFGKVKFRDVYPGIDLVFYGRQGELEYDLVVAPGHDPKRVCLRVVGAESLAIDKHGDLVIHTAAGSIRQERPVVYQEAGAGRKPVAARYVLRKGGEVELALGSYDRRRRLVIDPRVVFASYFGGTESASGFDFSTGVTTDGDGNVYFTGLTDARNLSGLVYPGDSFAGYVAKLNPAGTALLWATYIAGNTNGASSYAQAITVDAQQRVYVAGGTSSPTFPTKNAPYPTLRGDNDAWVVRLSATGLIDYATYLGGTFADSATDLAVDASGSAYVLGTTGSPDFPVTPGSLQTRYAGGNDLFLTKLSPDGTSVMYSTFLGGGAGDISAGLAVDAAGYAYVGAQTVSAELSIRGGFQTRIAGGAPAYITNTSGFSWNGLLDAPFQATVNSWLIPAADQSALYAGTSGQGIFLSRNAGGTWQALNNGLRDLNVRVMAADPANPSILFAGTSTSLYRSTDGGANWTERAVDNGPFDVSAIAISPANPANVYVSFARDLTSPTLCGGFYKSTDGGQTWTEQVGTNAFNIALVNMCAPNFILSPTDPQGSWVAFSMSDPMLSVYSGIYQFQAADGYWHQISTVGGLEHVIADPSNYQTLYGLSSEYGVIKSANLGANWAPINTGLPSNDSFNALAVSPGNSSTIYLGTGANGVYQSTNAGTSWSSFRANFPVLSITALAADPANTANVFAGTWYLPDAWVAVVNPEGTALLSSSFLGGSQVETPVRLAIDPAGNIYLTGHTASSDMAVTASALQKTLSGSVDAFVAKITSGGRLAHLSYLGGSGQEAAGEIRADAWNTVYVAGGTASTNFPLMKATQSALAGPVDAFLSRLDLTSGTLLYSTYLGGNGGDQAFALGLDANSNSVIAGFTTSTNLPSASSAVQPQIRGSVDSLVAKLSDPETILVAAGAPLNLTAVAGSGTLSVPLPLSSSGQPLQFTAAVAGASWLTLSAANGTTPAVLVLQIDTNQLSTGGYQGQLQLSSPQATLSPITIMVNVAVISRSSPVITFVANASGESPLIAPNTYVEIKGANLATSTRIWQAADFVNNRLPAQLDGVSVTFNGKKAYVYYISPTQINVLTAPDLAEGPVVAQVTNSAGASDPFTAQVRRRSPGFFTLDGKQLAARHADFSLLGAPNSIPGVTMTPAKGNEVVLFYGNGWGPTVPPVVDGSISQSAPLPAIPVIRIGGVVAEVQYAGLVLAGEYQFNVRVPNGLPEGDHEVTAEYNGFVSQTGVVINVQN